MMVVVEFVTAHLQWTSHKQPEKSEVTDIVDMVRKINSRCFTVNCEIFFGNCIVDGRNVKVGYFI